MPVMCHVLGPPLATRKPPAPLRGRERLCRALGCGRRQRELAVGERRVDETKDKAGWKIIPVSDASNMQIKHNLMRLLGATSFKHIEDIEDVGQDTPTKLAYEVQFLQCSVTAPPSTVLPPAPTSTEAPARDLVVQLLSGADVALEVPEPCTAQIAKELLARDLKVPVCEQNLLAEARELTDGDEVPRTVRLLRSEPPAITTEEFLRSLALSVSQWHDPTAPPHKKSIFEHWNAFDTHGPFPSTPEELRRWAMRHSHMKHMALSRDHLLSCFDAWLDFAGDTPIHPKSFEEDVDALISFLEVYCYSPSVLQVYDMPYHNDAADFVIFVVGRLRHSPGMLLTLAIHLFF